MDDDPRLGVLSTEALERLLAGDAPVVALVPVGSVEPHGPHLGLATDIVISEAAALRAVTRLEARDVIARVAPPVGYGVTDCAAGFPGAVSIPAPVLTAYLSAIVSGFVDGGFAHVCLVNNHLEPEHDRAVRASIEGVDAGKASVACPLTRRWARTLGAEFRSGACHAGRYETSIVLAAEPDHVDRVAMSELVEVPVSLSEALRAGVTRFRQMGLVRAYAGDPAAATEAEGDQLLDRLAEMIELEVIEALGRRDAPAPATAD